ASYELPGREPIESTAQRVYELLKASNQRQRKRESELAAAELSRMLLGPVSAALGRKRLLIVAEGALQYVPFAALPLLEDDPHNQRSFTPLIANHEIVNLPSASTLAVLRRETTGRQPAPRLVAALADPVLQADDSRVREAVGDRKPVSEDPAASSGASPSE